MPRSGFSRSSRNRRPSVPNDASHSDRPAPAEERGRIFAFVKPDRNPIELPRIGAHKFLIQGLPNQPLLVKAVRQDQAHPVSALPAAEATPPESYWDSLPADRFAKDTPSPCWQDRAAWHNTNKRCPAIGCMKQQQARPAVPGIRHRTPPGAIAPCSPGYSREPGYKFASE